MENALESQQLLLSKCCSAQPCWYSTCGHGEPRPSLQRPRQLQFLTTVVMSHAAVTADLPGSAPLTATAMHSSTVTAQKKIDFIFTTIDNASSMPVMKSC